MTVFLVALALLQNGYAKPAGWVDQSFADGIKVSAPRKLPLEKAEKGVVIDSWSDDSGSVTYNFVLTHPGAFKGDGSKDVLSAYVANLQGDIPGTIDGEKNLLTQGWPGIAITFVIGDQTLCCRAYAYGDRVAAVLCDFTTSKKRPPSVDQFLDSIQFPIAGPATTAGPALKRYPLGASGVSVLFPDKPTEATEPLDDTKKGGTLVHTFSSEYCLRNMVAYYVEFGPNDVFPTEAEKPQVYKDTLDQMTKELKGKTTVEREISFGTDKGLYREVAITESVSASIATVLHKNLSLNFVVVGPRAYSDSATIEAFLESAEFTDTSSTALFDVHSQIATQKTGDWVEQTFTGGFKVSAPVTLKMLDLSTMKSQGMPAGAEMWAGRTGDMAYLAISVKVPSEPGKSSSRLSDYFQGMVNKGQLKIESVGNDLLQGWAGISLTASKTGAHVVSRSFLVDDQIVSVMATTVPGAKPNDAPANYLNSLKLPKDGTATVAGPVLKRYPLGDSGISAVFPGQPEKRDETTKVMGQDVVSHIYGAPYIFRVFLVSYMDVPANVPKITEQELSQGYSQILDEITNGLGGKKTKERDMGFGNDTGLYREVSLKDGFSGLLAIVMHHKQIAVMMVIGPQTYKDQASIDTFLKSLQFKD